MADLIHYDSVQVLNNKLEEKNHYLEEQLLQMRHDMQELAMHTRELKDEREAFR